MSKRVYKRVYGKKDLSGAEIVGAVIFALLVGFIMLSILSWVVMLILGAIGAETGWFVGPSFFVTFLGMWLVSIISNMFRSK